MGDQLCTSDLRRETKKKSRKLTLRNCGPSLSVSRGQRWLCNMLFSCHYRLSVCCGVPVSRHSQRNFRRCWHALNCFSPFINMIYSFSYAAFRKYTEWNRVMSIFWIHQSSLLLSLFVVVIVVCVSLYCSTPKLNNKKKKKRIFCRISADLKVGFLPWQFYLGVLFCLLFCWGDFSW